MDRTFKFSLAVRGYSWDSDDLILHIYLPKSKEIQFFNCPKEVADRLARAPFKGLFIYTLKKNTSYPYNEISKPT